MKLEDYRPRSALVTQVTTIAKPRFPVIDAHNHLAGSAEEWDKQPVSKVLDVLDQAGVQAYVDLDGMWGENLLHQHLDHFKAAAPERFRIFTGVDWSAWPEQGNHFGEWSAARLRRHAARGADGLKVWKDFGLQVRDHTGALVKIDDERLDPLWATAGELGLPVTAHIADPLAFFWPLDEKNERYEELSAHPDWHFPSPPYPAFSELVEALARVVSRHPKTTFIGAHVSSYAENLQWVSDLFERCPNFYVDISARISELGRQPYTARRFFTQYADRIMFGIDASPNLETYRIYYRFLESADEYFAYNTGDLPYQGRWAIYGLYLPDDVLQKVYAGNARRIIFDARR
jgi:predicted TIM-barrel fold metal-dependent hydrolase